MATQRAYAPLYLYRGEQRVHEIRDYILDQDGNFLTLNANTTITAYFLRTNHPVSSGLNQNNWDLSVAGSAQAVASGYVKAFLTSANVATLCNITNANSFAVFWKLDIDGDGTKIRWIPRKGLVFVYG